MRKRVFCLLFVPLLVCIFSFPSLAVYPFTSVSLIESSDSSDLLLVSHYSEDDELISSEEISVPFFDPLGFLASYAFSFYGYQFSVDDVNGVLNEIENSSSPFTLLYLDNYLFVSFGSVPVPVSILVDIYLPPVSIPTSSVPDAVDSLSFVNDYYGTAFDETTPASTVISYAGFASEGVSPDRVVYVTPPLDLLPSVTDTVTASVGWLTDFSTLIVNTPLLLPFVLLTFVSVGITLIKRIKR